MRLSDRDIAAITDTAAALFGRSATVRLFGSRLYDDLKGGDIDLYVEVDAGSGGVGQADRFRDRLAESLGVDAPLDVLVHERGQPLRPIERLAAETGVVLGSDGGAEEPRQLAGAAGMTPAYHNAALLAEGLEISARNLAQLTWLRPRLADLLPLSAATMASLSRDRLIEIDAFLKRFENAQDIMQRRLFRAVLMAEGEAVRGQPSAEIAERLVARGALSDAAPWKALAELRNRLSHDYPLDPAVQAERVNQVDGAIPILVATMDEVRAHVGRAGLLTA